MHLYRIFEKKEEFHSDFCSTFLCREDISGRRYMRGFYNDVARLQVSLSLSTLTQPNSISDTLYGTTILQDVRKIFPHCSSDMEPGQVVP
jgi:O-palmitoleoyl-L-serine hydrolase